jgi:hypothetical protein
MPKPPYSSQGFNPNRQLIEWDTMDRYALEQMAKDKGKTPEMLVRAIVKEALDAGGYSITPRLKPEPLPEPSDIPDAKVDRMFRQTLAPRRPPPRRPGPGMH